MGNDHATGRVAKNKEASVKRITKLIGGLNSGTVRIVEYDSHRRGHLCSASTVVRCRECLDFWDSIDISADELRHIAREFRYIGVECLQKVITVAKHQLLVESSLRQWNSGDVAHNKRVLQGLLDSKIGRVFKDHRKHEKCTLTDTEIKQYVAEMVFGEHKNVLCGCPHLADANDDGLEEGQAVRFTPSIVDDRLYGLLDQIYDGLIFPQRIRTGLSCNASCDIRSQAGKKKTLLNGYRWISHYVCPSYIFSYIRARYVDRVFDRDIEQIIRKYGLSWMDDTYVDKYFEMFKLRFGSLLFATISGVRAVPYSSDLLFGDKYDERFRIWGYKDEHSCISEYNMCSSFVRENAHARRLVTSMTAAKHVFYHLELFNNDVDSLFCYRQINEKVDGSTQQKCALVFIYDNWQSGFIERTLGNPGSVNFSKMRRTMIATKFNWDTYLSRFDPDDIDIKLLDDIKKNHGASGRIFDKLRYEKILKIAENLSCRETACPSAPEEYEEGAACQANDTQTGETGETE